MRTSHETFDAIYNLNFTTIHHAPRGADIAYIRLSVSVSQGFPLVTQCIPPAVLKHPLLETRQCTKTSPGKQWKPRHLRSGWVKLKKTHWCILGPVQVSTCSSGIVNYHETPICKSQSRLLAFPTINATCRTRFSRSHLPTKRRLSTVCTQKRSTVHYTVLVVLPLQVWTNFCSHTLRLLWISYLPTQSDIGLLRQSGRE